MNKYKHLAPPPPKTATLVSRHRDKVKLPTRERAEIAAEKMGQKYHEKFTAYLCPVCGRYHVGHAWDVRPIHLHY